MTSVAMIMPASRAVNAPWPLRAFASKAALSAIIASLRSPESFANAAPDAPLCTKSTAFR